MASIPRRVLEYVSQQVNALSADAQARVLRVLESIEWTPGNIAECREIIVQALRAIMPTYTDAAAQAGADLYDAVRAAAVGEAMGTAAISGYEPDATEGAVRAFVDHIVKEGDVERFNREVLDRVDYDIRCAENVSVAENAALDPLKPRFARVPTGADTCKFCLMLASRGFVYTSREAASHAHVNCDCRVVQGYDGMEVEGYDPEAYLEMWRKSEELKDAKVPLAQRDAIMAAMRDRLIPQYAIDPSELAGIYQRGMESAWSAFKNTGKTRDGYETTVATYLEDIGEASGVAMSGTYRANSHGTFIFAEPDGYEIWAATKLFGYESTVDFLPSDRSLYPDARIDGGYAEIKTPSSAGKTARRLKHAARQLSVVDGDVKRVYLSALRVDDENTMRATAQRFVDDGTFDSLFLIRRDGSIEQIEKKR